MDHGRKIPVALALALASLLMACASTPEPTHQAAGGGADSRPVTADAGEPAPASAESDVVALHPESDTPEEEGSPDRFRFTTLRFWLYGEFLPEGDFADAFGIESNAAFGIGDWNFTNITYIELADYPRPVPGRPAGNAFPGLEGATGITDMLTAFLASPKDAHHGPHHFSGGFAAQLPTATDDTLGAGKWCIGPAVEYAYQDDRWLAAFVALQVWSFAGDPDRKSVNMMMIKPMVTYELSDDWKAVYMPYGVSIYWNKDPGEQVYLPIGAGIQRDFTLGSLDAALSLQFFKYVIRPSKGAEYDLRLMFELDF